MRHNGRAPIKASSLRPEHLHLREGETRRVVCPDCMTWRRLTRSMIHPHRDGVAQPKPEGRRYRDPLVKAKPSNGRRCPGSAQRVEIDITPEQWTERLLAAESTAASRRITNPVRKPNVATAPAVGQMATKRRTAAEDEKCYRLDGRARRAMWEKTAKAVRDTDRRRSLLPVGTALPRGAREVPLQPQHVAAHDARQAALGRSYAARAARRPASVERAAE
ncbi:hypothetical protein [Streptomyces sp. MNP-20]|uniref:hypothetical protein n=1 Tax=Streptomyces sp. MNP-20 TaxID=2721165 RepID=UPI001554B970|nr:hypothetical protein [Streptomyces sp. MNP-20]